MPHVVLTGDVNCEKTFDILEDIFVKLPKGILKTTDQYLEKNKKAILIESLAIEEGKKISFLVLLNDRDDGMVIRIYPGKDDIEKTNGVKRILAELGKQLLDKFENVTIGKTNLQEFL
ncbi:MAG: hypothetical protein GF308_19630 [Candidatus Heimdallarchaeota archaeon]|nr:hypothetical protein [Candidatus Heimdallarchaeota archaeon]